MKVTTKFLIGIIVLIVLSPLGLILPDHFKAGSAWGEWSVDEMQRLVGYVPQGMAKLSSWWNAPLPDYAFQGWEEKGLLSLSFSTMVSAAIGTIAVILVVFLLGKMLTKKSD